jgi:hypothetical protein
LSNKKISDMGKLLQSKENAASSAGQARSASQKFYFRLLLITFLFCGGMGNMYAQQGENSHVYVYLKDANVGTLALAEKNQNSSEYAKTGRTVYTNHNNQQGATYHLILPTVQENARIAENGMVFLILKKDKVKNSVFLAARFPSRTIRNSFLAAGRPWNKLNIYDAILEPFQFERLSSYSSSDYDIMGLPMLFDGESYVIEQFTYESKSSPTVTASLAQEPYLGAAGSGQDTYSIYEPLENTIDVTYTNPASYPVLLDCYQPVINYSNTTTFRSEGFPESSQILGGGILVDDDEIYSGEHVYLWLPANTSLKLKWGEKISYPDYKAGQNQSYQITAPVINHTVPPANKSVSSKLSDGKAHKLQSVNDMLSFYGGYPNTLPLSGERKINLLLGNTDKFLNIDVHSADYTQLGTISNLPQQDASTGAYPINLTTILNGQNAGNYYLVITGENNARYNFHFTLSSNVTAVESDAYSTQLSVIQESDGSLMLSRSIPTSSHDERKVLLTMTGIMEKINNTGSEDIVAYNIKSGALINGVLQLQNDGTNVSGDPATAKITWNMADSTIKFETLSDVNGAVQANLYAYKEKVFSTNSYGAIYNIAINLNSDTKYANSYSGTRDNPDDTGTPVEIRGGVRLQELGVGDLHVTDVNKVVLYLDGFSLGGQAQADCFIPNNWLDAKLTVDEFMFGEYGFSGTRGSLENATLGIDLFGQIGFTAKADISFDMLPKSRNRHFDIDGTFDLYQLFKATGSLGFVPIDDRYYEHTSDLPFDMWVPSSFYAEYDGTIGVCDLTLGVGAKNLHDYCSSNYFVNPPSIELIGTLGLGKGPLYVGGTAILGASHIGITNGKLKLFIDLLENVEAMYQHGGIMSNGHTIPWFQLSGSGDLNIFSILTGSAGAKIRVDLSKSRYGDTYILNMMDNLDSYSTTQITDALYDALDVQYWGNVSFAIPEGIPFVGLKASAGISGNKDYIRADAEFRANIDMGPIHENIDAYAWVKFKYSSPQDLTYGAGLRSMRQVQPGMPVYGYEYAIPVPASHSAENGLRSAAAGETSYITMTSNIIPVQKSSGNTGSLLRAFGDGYAATATELLSEDYDKIILRIRSKSDQTGLKITMPVKDTAQDTLYWQSYAANMLEWWRALDENETPLDYYEVSFPVYKDETSPYNFSGEWTAEAYNADATAPNAGGEIEMQLFVVLDPEVLSDVNLSGNNITFDTQNLDAEALYRISFALVKDTADFKDIYRLGTTAEFAGSNPLASFAMPDFDSDDFKTLNGNYFIKASLEKFGSEVQFEDSEETFRSYEPEWSAFSSTAVVSYTNPKDPGAVTNILAEAAGSGIAKVTWDASVNPNTDGFFITATDATGRSSVFTVEDAAAREWQMRAGQSVEEAGDTLLVSLETGRNYAFTVNAYHAVDSVTYVNGAEAAASDSLLIPEPKIYLLFDEFYVEKADGNKAYVIGGSRDKLTHTPVQVAGSVGYAQSTDRLHIEAYMNNMSEFGDPALKLRRSADGVNYTEVAVVPGETINTRKSFKVAMSADNFPKDTTYQMQALFYDQDATAPADTTVYEFSLVIDNTAPLLMLTSLEQDTASENSIYLLSGTTEAGASLYLDNKDITPDLVGKAFSVEISPATATLNFKAVDKAGNVASGNYIISSDFLTGNDDTKSVSLLTPYGKSQFNLGIDGTLQLSLLARIIDQNDNNKIITNAGDIEWHIYSGGRIASVSADTDSTAIVRITDSGAFTVMVTYKKLLADCAMFTISDADTSTGKALATAGVGNSVTITFSEPQSPESSPWLRSAETWKQIEYSCDQETWTVVPESALSWYPADSAKVNFESAGMQRCEGGIMYFRLNILDGPDTGTSNVTGLIVSELPEGMSHAKYVTFTANGIELFTDTVAYLTPVIEPAEPVLENQIFAGWYEENSFITRWNFEENLVENDMTLYGSWQSESGIIEIGQNRVSLVYDPIANLLILDGLHGSEYISIFDISGRILLRRQAVDNTLTIPANLLKGGVYLMQISSDNTTQVVKFVVN